VPSLRTWLFDLVIAGGETGYGHWTVIEGRRAFLILCKEIVIEVFIINCNSSLLLAAKLDTGTGRQ